jgi:hypothetical protein
MIEVQEHQLEPEFLEVTLKLLSKTGVDQLSQFGLWLRLYLKQH